MNHLLAPPRSLPLFFFFFSLADAQTGDAGTVCYTAHCGICFLGVVLCVFLLMHSIFVLFFFVFCVAFCLLFFIALCAPPRGQAANAVPVGSKRKPLGQVVFCHGRVGANFPAEPLGPLHLGATHTQAFLVGAHLRPCTKF